jgi:hypothetical protein
MTDPVHSRLLMIALAVSRQSWLFEEQRQGREPKTFLDLETPGSLCSRFPMPPSGVAR